MIPDKMMAFVCDEPETYGLREVDTPTIQDPEDVIGRVTLAAICTSDLHYIHGEIKNPLAHYPRIMGHEFCVEVVEVGSAVTSVKVGDHCVVRAASACHKCTMCKLGLEMACPQGGIFGNIGVLDGCHAEYVRIPFANDEGQMIPVPEGLTEEDVIMLPDMLATAWFGIKNAHLQEGQTVAIVGMGPVGQAAAVLAKNYFKASKVAAIDILPDRARYAVESGVADIAFDPADKDMPAAIKAFVGPLGFDAVIDTAGTGAAITMESMMVRPGGQLATVALFDTQTIDFPIMPMIEKDAKFTYGVQRVEGVPEMQKAIEDGVIDTHFMLTHRAPLNDIEEAYRVFEAKEDGCIKYLITPFER